MARKKFKRKRLKEDLTRETVRALELIETIQQTIEGLPERVQGKGADFFESVMDKAKDIGETIERTDRVTVGQTKALENMLSGVRRWVHGDGD